MKIIVIGIATLMFTNASFAQGTAHDLNKLEQTVASLENENAGLKESLSDLTAIVADLVEQQRCHTNPQYGVDWHGCDKSGLELQGPNVDGDEDDGNLTNSDLRFVNFTGANLIGVTMWGVNLEGADFTNASLAYSVGLVEANVIPFGDSEKAETVFANTTCPDETNSNDNGGTCIGHF